MSRNIETLVELEAIAESAMALLEKRNTIRPKLPRTFDRPDAVEYLKSDYRTIEKHAAEIGINPKAYASQGIKWMLTLDEIYKIRDVLPDTTILKKQFTTFKRLPSQKTQILVNMNQKGGVGKTMACITLATGIAVEFHEGYRVCVIDMDGQSTLSAYQPSIAGEVRPTIGQLMQLDPESGGYGEKIRQAISDTTIPNLKIIPAAQNDRDVENIFHEGVFSGEIKSPYTRLKSVIEQIKDDFDVILIDTPPSLGFASINAYYAATSVIMPVGANLNDTDATCQYLSYLSTMYKNLIAQGHQGYDFVKLLLTNFEENSATSLEVQNELSDYFNAHLMKSTFKKSEAIKRCSLDKNTVYDLSKSMYDGHKATFKNAKINADAILFEVMRLVRTVWEQEANK